ncbi:MAG: spore coat protein [Clostridia bacterium]|nr:spore coat protein [Clostridia bacterium]
MDTQSTVTSNSGVKRIGKPVSNELPKVKDSNMNVRDRLNDVLLTEKHNLVSYQIGINEIINDDLRSLLTENRNRLQDLHNRFFNDLFNLGEYQADLASSAQIKDSVDVFTNYKSQFSNNQ